MPRNPNLGAYHHPLVDEGRDAPQRWSCRVVGPDGREAHVTGATQTDCWNAVAKQILRLGVRPTAHNLTMTAAAILFITDRCRADAWSDSTVLRMRQDLALLCQPPALRIADFGRPELEAWLDRMRVMRVGSQRTRWGGVAGFWTWAVAREIVPANPLRLVDRLDKPWLTTRAKRQAAKGKRQLANTAEAGKYLAAAAQWPTANLRIGAAMPLLLGLRSGELRHIRVGDVDTGLSRLWIRDVDDDDAGDGGWSVKTASSRRVVELPAALRADILQLCENQTLDAFLLRSPSARGGRSRGQAFNGEWLRRLVARTCAVANVTTVCAHGLRGTYASILAAVGEASPDIGRHLGHADRGKTAERHYIGAETTKPALRLVPESGLGQGRHAGSTVSEDSALWRSGRDLNPRKLYESTFKSADLGGKNGKG